MLGAASTVHASVGFGTALVVMPLLVPLLGFAVATPLVGLAALFSVLMVLGREWRALAPRAAARLLVATLPGIPLGAALVMLAPSSWLRAGLGVLLVAYGGWSLARPRLPRLAEGRSVYVFGFLAGLLGGAYNTNAPPLVLYGALVRWPPARFRATLSGYFLFAAAAICLGHALSGLWTARVLTLLAYAAPVIVAGNLSGAWLARRIPQARFTVVLYALLVLLGALMLA
ncbi:MAG: sulfite exporter TauE/SafE family protein [Gammaproteobacteria bacterium]